MLEAMRRGAQTVVAKLLFGILVFSFSIWGVADVFRGWGRGSIATVGSTAITAEEFNRSFQQELDRFSREANQRITAEQGRAIGIDKRVLGQLVGGAAIETHAKDLGLALSDATLVKGVESDADFQRDGKFSKPEFDALLRQIGMSEQTFLSLRRKDELRRQIIASLVKAQTVPKPLFDLMHDYNQEKRVIEWIKIDPNEAVKVAEPDEAKLKEAYEADKAKYMTPEYRKVQVLTLTPEDFKKQFTFTDDEIAKAYEATKDTYNTPEERRIQQIAFKDKATAEAALKALNDGTKTFADVAKEAGAKDTDVDLGLIKKKSLIDPKVADVAFSLEKDKFSPAIEGRFATVIVRVTQIEPGTNRTLAEVKDDVRDKLASDKASGGISAKHDEIEDARIAGKTLAEIGKEQKLPYKEVAAIDRQGQGADGKPALEVPDLQKVVGRVFAPDSGGDDSAIELLNDSYAWVNVISTEPPKQKAFDQVKDQVKANYMASERKKLIGELAKKLVEKLNSGQPFSALEAEAKNKPEKTDPITRKTIPQSISEAVVAQAFSLKKDKAGHGPSSDKSTEIVFRVIDVFSPPAATLTETETLNHDLEADLVNQSLTEYTEALKRRYNASINEAEFKAALGISDQ